MLLTAAQNSSLGLRSHLHLKTLKNGPRFIKPVHTVSDGRANGPPIIYNPNGIIKYFKTDK
jgi:hypothetical protein